jgi:hypothetical protein
MMNDVMHPIFSSSASSSCLDLLLPPSQLCKYSTLWPSAFFTSLIRAESDLHTLVVLLEGEKTTPLVVFVLFFDAFVLLVSKNSALGLVIGHPKIPRSVIVVIVSKKYLFVVDIS